MFSLLGGTLSRISVPCGFARRFDVESSATEQGRIDMIVTFLTLGIYAAIFLSALSSMIFVATPAGKRFFYKKEDRVLVFTTAPVVCIFVGAILAALVNAWLN